MGCVGVKKCLKINNIQDSPPLLTTKLIRSNKLGLNMNIKKEKHYLNMDYNNISKGNLLIVLSFSMKLSSDITLDLLIFFSREFDLFITFRL